MTVQAPRPLRAVSSWFASTERESREMFGLALGWRERLGRWRWLVLAVLFALLYWRVGGPPYGWVPVVAGFALGAGWRHCSIGERVVYVLLSVMAVQYTIPSQVSTGAYFAALIATRLLLPVPEHARPPGPLEREAERLFHAIAPVLGVATTEEGHRQETPAEIKARGGRADSRPRRVPIRRPVPASRFVRLAGRLDDDGRLVLDADGRPAVAEAHITAPPSFQVSRRPALREQVAAFLGVGQLLEQWPAHNRVVYRPYPPLSDGYRYEHLDGLAWDDVVLGQTDPGARFARELAGAFWCVISMRLFPHLLITGSTGAGKSSAIRALVAQLLKRGWELLVCDGKGGEFRFLAGRAGIRSVTAPDPSGSAAPIVETCRVAHAELLRRLADVDAAAEAGRPGPSFRPWLLLVDEFSAILGALDEAGQRDLLGLWQDLAQRGRSVRVFVALANQSAYAYAGSTPGLPGPVKGLLRIKLGVGFHSTVWSQITFDDSMAGQSIEDVPGRGLAMVGLDRNRVQGPWLANPETDEEPAEREEAARWFPPATDRPVRASESDSVARPAPASDGMGEGLSGRQEPREGRERADSEDGPDDGPRRIETDP
jgi:hypothetical protein